MTAINGTTRENRAMSERKARINLSLALPAIAAAVGLLPYLVFRSDLPDRLATHWSSSGMPDGSMTHGGFLAFTAVMFAIGAAMCIGMAVWARPLPSITGLGVATLGGFLMGLAAGIAAETAITQRNLTDWTDASLSWLGVIISVGLALTFAAGAAWIAGFLPRLVPALDSAAQPVMALADGEAALWRSTLRSPVLAAVGLAASLGAVAIAVVTSEWTAMVVVALCALSILALGSITVRADRTGLNVKYGLLPWPRTTIAVEEMASAAVIDVKPMQWGGWGYRGSLKIMKQAAVVLRKGPGIRVDLRNGKVFVVTIDHPAGAVALLNGEINRNQPAAV